MLLLTLLPTFSPALAYSSGITGYSTSGCSCHARSADSTTTVSFPSLPATVEPGETITVEFTVSTTSSTRTAAGLNVSASSGTLAAGSNTRLSSREVTHSSRESMSSSTATFELEWTAPTTEGTYTLYGAGNAVNADRGSSGDAWNVTSDTITVEAGPTCVDDDGDGYEACDDGSGEDCDDGDATAYPDAEELCDEVDNDCDGDVDEGAVGTFYTDADADGYGNDADAVSTCPAPAGTVDMGGDCNDEDATVNPAADEICDEIDTDEDCDGLADDEDASVVDAVTFYTDSDGDAFGAGAGVDWCDPPAGVVETGTDCDDTSPTTWPGAPESCDSVDNDCDGAVDDGLDLYYPDADGDGYGDAAATATCEPGGVMEGGDCDDTSNGVYPGQKELWYDGIDQNCDGNDDDQDLDGYPCPDDCDDIDAEVNPGGTETWYDGVDTDCSGGSDYDQDGDTHDSASHGGDDCDDADPFTFPGAADAPYDGVVTDCNAADEYDQDGDGVLYPKDCDDANSKVTTGTTWYADEDGDGHGVEAGSVVDCTQPDGYAAEAGDCDDADPAVWDDCTGETGDPNETGDTGPVDDTGPGETGEGKDGGCGCTTGGSTAGWGALLALGALVRRRR